jgi:hypothetical protein
MPQFENLIVPKNVTSTFYPEANVGYTYTFEIQAENNVGRSGRSATGIKTIVPKAPPPQIIYYLPISDLTANQFTLNWVDVSPLGGNQTIQLRNQLGLFQTIGTLPKNSTRIYKFDVKNVDPARTYYLRVLTGSLAGKVFATH